MSDNKISTELLKLMLNPDSKVQSTLHEAIEETQSKIVKAAKDSTPINDSYGNSLLGIGTKDKTETFASYGFSNDTLNWPLWLALYNDSWVFKRAIDKPSQDMVSAGISIQLEEDNGSLSNVYKDLKKCRFDLIQLLQWGALFGGSIAVMMFDNVKDNEYQNPLDKKKIQASKAMKLYVVDRWYGVSTSTETVINMQSLDFGKPKYYAVTFADGKTIKIHHDYILRYEHRVAPKLVKNGMLQGWGYAEGSHILSELSRDDKLKASIQSLVDKSLIEIIKMNGMRGVFMGADQDNEEQLKKRLEMVNWGRNFNSLTFLDSQDDYQQNQFSGLSGLSDLLEKNMWLISAALEMQGVLFGDLKQGFANDAEALERYDQTIRNRCESYFQPVLEKLLTVFYIKYDIHEHVEFEFDSLLKKDEDKRYIEGVKEFSALLSQLLGDGVITPTLYAKALQLYITKGIVDLGLDEEEIKKIDERVDEESEEIDEMLKGDI